MLEIRVRVRLRTWLAAVAFFAVFLSVLSREAKQQRGWIIPGDVMIVEVLEAAPGHPITGPFPVRSDGTIDLGYYGRLKAANLTRTGFKTAVANHLRTYLNDEILGLEVSESDESQSPTSDHKIAPADSLRVYVDFDEGSGAKPPTIYNESILDQINLYLGHESILQKRRYSGPCCPSTSMPVTPNFTEQAMTRLVNIGGWVTGSLGWAIHVLSIPLVVCFLSTLEKNPPR
jgi:hypothetical protein